MAPKLDLGRAPGCRLPALGSPRVLPCGFHRSNRACIAAVTRASQPKKRVTPPPPRGLRPLVPAPSPLVRANRILSALHDVARALGNPNDLDTLLELILAKTIELLDADRATLYLLEEPSGQLVSRHVVGGQVQSIRVNVGEGIAGSVVSTGKAMRVADAYRNPRFNRAWDAVTGYRTRSILAVPMQSCRGEVLGVLQVLNKRTGSAFTLEDQELLGALATQAGISIDNTNMFLAEVRNNQELHQARQRLERKVADLNLLFELESTMARASSTQELVASVLQRTVAAARTRAGALLLANTAGAGWTLHSVREGNPDEVVVQPVEAIDGPLARALRKGEPVRTSDRKSHALRHTPGRPVVAVPLHGEGNAAIGAIGLFDRIDGSAFAEDDVELLRLVAANASTALSLLQARDEKQEVARMSTIGTLLSGVLHDLKGPMTIINGYVQLMAATDDRRQRKSYSELVLRQVEHITAMQKEVLAFARGERSVFVRRVYLNQFFDELKAQLEREIEGRSVELHFALADRGIARFDEIKIMRALQNLARNAIEAMGRSGGKLSVETERDQGALLIRVSDTGPGIPKELEGRLFGTFVTSGKAGGTGLGLAIVKKIAEEHGGGVEVVSSKKGATFTLRLPQPEEPVG